MTITTNSRLPAFDEDPALEALDRTQSVNVRVALDFVVLEQWDGTAYEKHTILLERRDIPAFIKALEAHMPTNDPATSSED